MPPDRLQEWIDACTPAPDRPAPSVGAQAALDNAREAVAGEAVYFNSAGISEYRRGMIAMRLANDLEAYRALLRGEPVHPSRLDREYLAELRRQGLWQ